MAAARFGNTVGWELGINGNMIGRWEKERTANGSRAFLGSGKPRDEEMMKLKRELNRVDVAVNFHPPSPLW